jgi:hypothetical protein
MQSKVIVCYVQKKFKNKKAVQTFQNESFNEILEK